jgi:hypothetical protein
MIIVYSSKPYNVKQEDIDKFKLEGEKVDMEEVKAQKKIEMENRRGRQKSQPKKNFYIRRM